MKTEQKKKVKFDTDWYNRFFKHPVNNKNLFSQKEKELRISKKTNNN
jgi:hypothetical protein